MGDITDEELESFKVKLRTAKEEAFKKFTIELTQEQIDNLNKAITEALNINDLLNDYDSHNAYTLVLIDINSQVAKQKQDG